MSAAYPVRAIDPGEYRAFYAVSEHAFNSSWPAEGSSELARTTFEFDRSAAAFDGAQIVGTAANFTFRLSVPGATVAAAGVSFVAVLPSHRRRGIMSALIRYLLADAIARDEPVAVLWAAEPEIYGRFGYGCASHELNLAIRSEARLVPPPLPGRAGAEPPRLRIADPAAVRSELAAVYDPLAAGRPGAIARDDRWWGAVTADPEWAREGAAPLRCVLACDDRGPRGYALYSAKPTWGDDSLPAGQLNVRELVAADAGTELALWTDLLSRDLITEVRAAGRPLDDPLLQWLGGPRRARARLMDGLWARLIDVPAALRQRRYACDVDVVIEVTDAELPANCGRWRLQAGAGEQASCEPATAAADLTATAQALGAAYLGGTGLASLAAAGQVTASRPAALATLTTAMSADREPWCPTEF
ncbi:MAG TPA: GNAT family N-acetyltransferase [Streptosporangiaceae bacterium]|jgi:predicted acetyltransferase